VFGELDEPVAVGRTRDEDLDVGVRVSETVTSCNLAYSWIRPPSRCCRRTPIFVPGAR
jgi:hypothetical protein